MTVENFISREELTIRYEKDNPPPIKPARMWKSKAQGILTNAYQKYHKLITEHTKKLNEYINRKIDGQLLYFGITTKISDEAIERIDGGFEDEESNVRFIKVWFLNEEQKSWLSEKNYDIADLLNGRYVIELEREIRETFYKPWNRILRANGVKPQFTEELLGKAMIESIERTLLEQNPDIKGIEFE